MNLFILTTGGSWDATLPSGASLFIKTQLDRSTCSAKVEVRFEWPTMPKDRMGQPNRIAGWFSAESESQQADPSDVLNITAVTVDLLIDKILLYCKDLVEEVGLPDNDFQIFMDVAEDLSGVRDALFRKSLGGI